ncbi:MAG: tail fiber domain-containing protein [Candidatus Zixiibacteriota bacterium]
MKKALFILILSLNLTASMPYQFSFQGRLTDDSGFPAEGSYPVEFRLYNQATGGTELWSESHIIQFSGGLFNAYIGTEGDIPIELFENDSLYLETIIESETLTPRRRIMPQPYAIRAHYADSAGNFDMDTLGAYIDTTYSFAENQTKMKIDGGSWIEDSIVFMEGSNVLLEQSGNSITINSSAGSSSPWIIEGESMYPDFTGNVGIGTSSPLLKLHVDGSTYLDGSLVVTGLLELESPDTLVTVKNGLLYKSILEERAGRWNSEDSVLYTDNYLGIARGNAENNLLGDETYSHVNLGISSTTGDIAGTFGSVVLGGENNVSLADYSVVAGGKDNSASSIYSTVCGGLSNSASEYYSTVCGGIRNRAIHRYSFVGGGYENHADYLWATVAGGDRNKALWDHSTIGGGEVNTANAEGATIAGGRYNQIEGDLGTIAGGFSDTVFSHLGTVSGGFANQAGDSTTDSATVVSGGMHNEAAGKYSVVGGGIKNHALGERSAIPGGSYLRVGRGSFGFRGGVSGNPSSMIDVSAMDETFHIVDANFHFNYSNTTADFVINGSTDDLLHCDGLLNRVAINSEVTHGYKFYVDGGAAKPGEATWAVYSDRRLKRAIEPYEHGLKEIIQLKPVNYEYNGQNNIQSEGRYTGFIAQDIADIIPDAVKETESGYLAVHSDAIIWAMLNAVKELEAENRELEDRVERLEDRNQKSDN